MNSYLVGSPSFRLAFDDRVITDHFDELELCVAVLTARIDSHLLDLLVGVDFFYALVALGPIIFGAN